MRGGERGVRAIVASEIARERRASTLWGALNIVIGPLIRLWLFAMMTGIRRAPRPEGTPVVHATGADPDRILLVGNGPALGFGVVDWDLSLAGYLARRVATGTSRGVDVKVIAHLHM